MEAALHLDPSMPIARLQLGLMWLTTGDAERAAGEFSQLTARSEDDAVTWFGRGFVHLLGGDFDEMEKCMRKGIALNLTNAPLNANMERVLAEASMVGPR
jgi:Tfp pilus assembly protein PilF